MYADNDYLSPSDETCMEIVRSLENHGMGSDMTIAFDFICEKFPETLIEEIHPSSLIPDA